MTFGKDLSLTKKKLDCLRMKMFKGVCLRRVKLKALFIKGKWEKTPFPLICHLSTKYASWWTPHLRLWTCVYGTLCLCVYGDWSLFKVFESKKGGNVTFGDGSKS